MLYQRLIMQGRETKGGGPRYLTHIKKGKRRPEKKEVDADSQKRLVQHKHE